MTTVNKWTKGEWHPGCFVRDDTSCECNYIFGEGYTGSIAQVSISNRKHIQHGGNDAPPLEEAKANAHLISAAPDLYEACELVLKRLGELNHDDEAGARMVLANALAKARGE